MSRRPRTTLLARVVSALGAVGLALALGSAGMAPAAAATYSAVPVPGSPDGSYYVTTYGGSLYLTGSNGSTDVIFEFDGTTFTEVPGSPEYVHSFTEYNGLLYMAGIGTGGNYSLFSFDGTTFDEIAMNISPFNLIVYEGDLVFGGDTGADEPVTLSDVYGLFQYDGVTVTPIPGSPLFPANRPVLYDGALMLTASIDGLSTGDVVLYRYQAGVFAQIAATPTGPEDLAVQGGSLYFTAFDGSDYYLYSYTAVDGIDLVPGAPDQPDQGVVFNGPLYFTGNDPAGRLLFTLNAGVVAPVAGAPEAAGGFHVIDGVMYLSAWDENFDRVPFTFGGTTFTRITGNAYYPQGFTAFNGKIYFLAVDGPDGESYSLYVLDETLAPTGVDALAPLGASAILLAAGLGAFALSRRPIKN